MTKEQAKRRLYPTSVPLQGVVVSCCFQAINEIYFEMLAPRMAAYDTKMANMENEHAWAASIIAKGTAF